MTSEFNPSDSGYRTVEKQGKIEPYPNLISCVGDYYNGITTAKNTTKFKKLKSRVAKTFIGS